MADSNITVAGLTATPTVRGIKLAWTVTDPNANGLPYLALKIVEVWASTTDDRATASKVVEGITEASFEGAIEEQTYYFWIKAKNASDLYGDWYPSGGTSGVAGTAIGMAGLAFGLANGKLVASVAGSALTIAVKTAAGNDPSVSDPVYVAFRNSTAATGNYQIRSITAALSLVISSGSTLGVANATPFRVWVVLFDDVGTLRLGAAICTTVNSVLAIDESALLSSTAEGGAGAADTSLVLYTGSAVTTKPLRILGFMTWDSGLTTAGTWDAVPSKIQMFGPGVKKPGEVIQSISNISSAPAQGTTAIPADDTIPQNNEGDEYFSTTVVLSSPANYTDHDVLLYSSAQSGAILTAAIFQDSASDAFAAAYMTTGAVAGEPVPLPIRARKQAGVAGSSTFKVRAGQPTPTATYALNGTCSGGVSHRFAGGSMFSGHRIQEVQA